MQSHFHQACLSVIRYSSFASRGVLYARKAKGTMRNAVKIGAEKYLGIGKPGTDLSHLFEPLIHDD
jgi:hypothetical protein